MLFEMKYSKHNLSRLQESKEPCAPIPLPGAVSALETHTRVLGMGPVPEGLELSALLLALRALNHHRHIPGSRQLQPAASEGEELPSAHLQGLAEMSCVPCNMHY